MVPTLLCLRPRALFRYLVYYIFCSAPNQIRQECLSGPPGYFFVHISLANLEVQQMNLVAKLDVFRLVHFSACQRGFALLTPLLVAAFCRHVWRSFVEAF